MILNVPERELLTSVLTILKLRTGLDRLKGTALSLIITKLCDAIVSDGCEYVSVTINFVYVGLLTSFYCTILSLDISGDR